MPRFECTVVLGLFYVVSLTSAKKWTSPLPDIEQCGPLVIAHRGASGYVPEHTLGAYALAITMGADYVEPDLVMTKDGYLIARHENDLSRSTDVAEHPEFSDRYRTQSLEGRRVSGWFSEDFTLMEVKTLRAKEQMANVRPCNARSDGAWDIPTLQEIVNLVKHMHVGLKRTIGIYPEIKHGTHFQGIGLEMVKPLVHLLQINGYQGPESPVFIQSFEVSILKALKNFTDIRLVQLYGGSSRQPFDQAELGTGLTYGDMATAEGLKEVATYAYGVGPDKSYIIPKNLTNNLGKETSFVKDAHAAGLKVHPYTFRAENLYLPREFQSNSLSISAIGNLAGEIKAFLATGIDGIFVDQPDVLVRLKEPCLHLNAPRSGM